MSLRHLSPEPDPSLPALPRLRSTTTRPGGRGSSSVGASRAQSSSENASAAGTSRGMRRMASLGNHRLAQGTAREGLVEMVRGPRMRADSAVRPGGVPSLGSRAGWALDSETRPARSPSAYPSPAGAAWSRRSCPVSAPAGRTARCAPRAARGRSRPPGGSRSRSAPPDR